MGWLCEIALWGSIPERMKAFRVENGFRNFQERPVEATFCCYSCLKKE